MDREREVGMTATDEMTWREVDEALRRIGKERKVVSAAGLNRNTLIHDGDRLESGKGFSGEWVAIPREDYDRLRRALDNLDEEDTDGD